MEYCMEGINYDPTGDSSMPDLIEAYELMRTYRAAPIRAKIQMAKLAGFHGTRPDGLAEYYAYLRREVWRFINIVRMEG